ncbi:hypothetical protein [Kitasatospora sp. NPDC047058]|uniref:hypothetical protein n=1 Tax=Kitasatospora sp. NPDC047058 TaxID=3155620 RepID=UPI0033C35974
MRARHLTAAVAVLAVLGVPACSAGSQDRPATGATSVAAAGAAPGRVPLQDRLRAGLLTGDRLPQGFRLNTAEVESTTTGAPHGPASAVPIASMPCSELGVESFMTAHAPPAEDVAVGLDREPVDHDDLGWSGQEALDRYPPGQAAEVMAAIRGAAARCASYTNTLSDGTPLQETVSVTAAGVPADDGLLLHVTSVFPGGTNRFVDETAFVRTGDVILMVQEVAEEKPSADTETVLSAAVAAYRSAAAG